jgi:hypothetical protein
MKNHLAIVTGILVAATLQACATTAPRIDPALAMRVENGVQDRARIAAWFGPTDDVEHLRVARGACTDAAHWSHPTSTTYENLTVYFDANGIVCGHSYSGPNRPRGGSVDAVAVAPSPASRRLARN